MFLTFTLCELERAPQSFLLFFPPPLDTLESSLEMDTRCAASSGKRHRLHLGRHTVQAGGFTESWSQLLARWNKADNSLHVRLSLPMPCHYLSTSSSVFAFIFCRVTAQHIFWLFAYDKYTFHRAGLRKTNKQTKQKPFLNDVQKCLFII